MQLNFLQNELPLLLKDIPMVTQHIHTYIMFELQQVSQ
jgi:hypothetical protein